MVKISFDEPAQEPQSFVEPALSDAAAKRIMVLISKPESTAKFLRVAILGGGCNGYSYHFKLEDVKKESDKELINSNFSDAIVIVDADSYQLLNGATITYVDTIEASQFVIENPNATSSCGCGNSFGL